MTFVDFVVEVHRVLAAAGVPHAFGGALALDDRYTEIEARTVEHPFGSKGARLPFLSPEDLCLFKLSFGREKDWVDLRAIASPSADLDTEYVERQLIGLRGPAMHPRMSRFLDLLRQERG